MEPFCCLDIGGVSVRISSTLDIGCPSSYDGAHYEYFEGMSVIPEDGRKWDIDVAVTRGGIPELTGYDRIARTDSWSLFAKTDQYVICLQPASIGHPLWYARCDSDFTRVQVQLAGDITPYNPIHYPLDQILLLHHLAARQGAILHAAGMICAGRGYIFPGVSGAGKTTLSRLLMANPDLLFLSDDRVIIRREKTDDKPFCYGTPWPGEAGLAQNQSAPLAAVYFLRQAKENKISLLPPRAAFERFMPVASIPWYHRQFVAKLLDFFEQLVQAVPVYDFLFTPDSGATACLEHSITARS